MCSGLENVNYCFFGGGQEKDAFGLHNSLREFGPVVEYLDVVVVVVIALVAGEIYPCGHQSSGDSGDCVYRLEVVVGRDHEEFQLNAKGHGIAEGGRAGVEQQHDVVL